MTTTLAELALAVLRIVMPDAVVSGAATAGSTSSLTDTVRLVQPQQYWDKGTLWIQSGTHVGKVWTVTGFNTAVLSFATVTGAIAAGVRYTVGKAAYPYTEIVAAINNALGETHVEAEDSTLAGDGDTLEFTLPTGVSRVVRVEIKNPDDTTGASDYRSTHWRERNGKLKFDFGYAPEDGYDINIVYRAEHAELVDYDDTVSDEISLEWLKWKAAEYLLNWSMGVYGSRAEYRIEERIGLTQERLKKLAARLHTDIVMRTAGA